jgi:hypothetical protein
VSVPGTGALNKNAAAVTTTIKKIPPMTIYLLSEKKCALLFPTIVINILYWIIYKDIGEGYLS